MRLDQMLDGMGASKPIMGNHNLRETQSFPDQ
jgi:hypothetical protein